MSDIVVPDIGDIINGKYQVTKRIGAGSFGAIYEVQELESGKMLAVKLERPTSPSPQLQYEHRLYQILDGAYAIPRVYDFWTEENWRGMAMDRLGCSLGYYFRKCGKILSMKTTIMCGIQMLSRLEYLHERSFIHRDIKPDNFVFGVGKNSNLLFLIDLGLAKKYRDLISHAHITYSEDKGLAGTARYVSINVHYGVEQSCRDDLESVGYVLISLINGTLPWQGMEACSNNEKYELIQQSKVNTTLETLCENLPNEFLVYMMKVRSLLFDERPPYALFRALFAKVMTDNNYAYDYKYDWIIPRAQRLDAALRSTPDVGKTPISVHTINIQEIVDTGKQVDLMQPLPFYSILTDAALFVGLSRKAEKGEEKKEQKKSFTEQQSIFLLDPRKIRARPGILELEFLQNPISK
ncbi:CK1 family protein kinase [Trichomonas vaginalis G3]|uniref:non-specific serine/threonine protein kinase n=1 Tax=Trichomonas vaginalis (strain ATCC PRA-98 / G3) TaxID=412133 RepID=A2DBC0_TRIV3|nr:STKc CK1 domain-containing protein [Trichomonas vaginalis G3]EAY22450.1 CK1 family protein kinase [Trichomonas vaginalis G3]KAI5517611.1 STKc CK1 domain-containing protein [Trichomonas vaginalis G3]|eukprot:XP_001583436.1 CK1 family protein kinase [Trichomonas vaginalis G3]